MLLGSVTRAGLSQPGYATHFSASTDLSDTSGTGVEDRVLNVSPQQDSDLIQESSFFKAGQTVKNPLITRYFIEPKNLCDGPSGPPYLLVLVPSLSSHVSMRRVIRDTWGSVVRKPWPRTSNLPKMQIVFFFGKSTYDRERFVLEKENVTHGDVVYADFHDSYRNLTFKTLTSLYWASTRCPGAKFVMKVDEDTFVNVPYLMEYLHYHQDSLAHSVVGYAHRKPVSVRTGRWAVRFKDYPLPVFPRYLYGHSYVIARDAVRSLVDVSRGYTCAVVKNTKVTITMITETSHRQIWEARNSHPLFGIRSVWEKGSNYPCLTLSLVASFELPYLRQA
nr:hypothetical protein BaRGS_024603 [Batillaria attramentaria]